MKSVEVDGDFGADGVFWAAHELKAPLAVLRQLAFSLEGMDVRGEHIRSEMISVSERAIRQVNDLTRMRRLEDGLFVMEPVAVREVCDAAAAELGRLFRCNRKGLRVEYTNRARLVNANRELLYSVIYNFLMNAMHYSNEGAQSILRVKDSGDRVRVAVRDFGPALPMEIWRKMRKGQIKEPTAIAMRPGSSGLGLLIASKFSEYMNSEVGAVRHRDGASFYVEIPISRQARLF